MLENQFTVFTMARNVWNLTLTNQTHDTKKDGMAVWETLRAFENGVRSD